MVPYSGTIRPRVIELAPGRAVVQLRDRRAVRNHLRSVHAVALANLGELASGLAMTTALPDGIRAIVTQLTIEFTKKARGTLTAVGTGTPPTQVEGPMDIDVETRIRDESGDEVAVVRVTWRLAPR